MNRQSPGPILRREFPLEKADPLLWLRGRSEEVKSFWSSREGDFEAAGAGAAEWIAGGGESDLDALFQTFSQKLKDAPAQCRFFGGFRFGQGTIRNGAWEPFGQFFFVLPRYEVLKRGSRAFLAVNVRKNELSRFLPAVKAMLKKFQSGTRRRKPLPSSPDPLKRSDFPARGRWVKNVEAALKAIERGACEKIVLARKSQFLFPVRVDPLAVLEKLKAANPGAYHFCFQRNSGQAFIGGSPERLYRRAGEAIQTEAVAGTRPRGKNVADDRHLGAQLLSSQKDIWEHELVVRGIREAMDPLCHKLKMLPGPRLLRLTGLQHLHRGFEGILRPGVTDADLLGALHPTPAVSGYPSRLALNEIRRLEAFDRGWYAAPVGWMGPESAEFAVGIRSGLVTGRSLALFSGAGVVSGSNPAAEWDEIESKIGGFLQAIKT